MKIIDCFTYCGEDLLLKIRLDTLYNLVDKFVIVEGNKYFNGDNYWPFFNSLLKYEYSFVTEFYNQHIKKYNIYLLGNKRRTKNKNVYYFFSVLRLPL